MSFSTTSTRTFSPASLTSHLQTSSNQLRLLKVSVMAVHAGAKDRSRHHASSERGLHQVELISVAVSSSNECPVSFEITILMKTTTEYPTTQVSSALSMFSARNIPGSVYRIKKQFADFEALRSALYRAVQVTHLLSSCAFCKSIKVLCAARTSSPELSNEGDNNQLALQQFINDILKLVMPIRLSSDERACYGKLQCRQLLSLFLHLQTPQAR